MSLSTLFAAVPWVDLAKLADGLSAVASLGLKVAAKLSPRVAAYRAVVQIASKQGAREFTKDQFDRARRHYIEPYASPLDPAGAESFRQVLSISNSLFKVLDEVISGDKRQRFLFILADSGMGKTSALLNFFARNQTRFVPIPMAIIYLGRKDVIGRIASIANAEETVLLLDALDEDPEALTDHVDRLSELIKAAKRFRAVIITCRSQFFSKDEEITQETGVAYIGPRDVGQDSTYKFSKLYLEPLTNIQVEKYLRRRYGIVNRKRRREAERVIGLIDDLSARPMLLSYIDDLLEIRGAHVSLTAAYEQIVMQWLRRESSKGDGNEKMLKFCQRLALDLVEHRAERGGEHVSQAELTALAGAWDVGLALHRLTGRSLLNRDAIGRFKFAHRSILEFLVVSEFVRSEPRCLEVAWTDQMLQFLADGTEPDGIWSVQIPSLIAKLLSVESLVVEANARFALALLVRSCSLEFSQFRIGDSPPRALFENLCRAIFLVARACLPVGAHFEVTVSNPLGLSEARQNASRLVSQASRTSSINDASIFVKMVHEPTFAHSTPQDVDRSISAEDFNLDPSSFCTASIRVFEPESISVASLELLDEVFSYETMWELGQRPK